MQHHRSHSSYRIKKTRSQSRDEVYREDRIESRCLDGFKAIFLELYDALTKCNIFMDDFSRWGDVDSHCRDKNSGNNDKALYSNPLHEPRYKSKSTKAPIRKRGMATAYRHSLDDVTEYEDILYICRVLRHCSREHWRTNTQSLVGMKLIKFPETNVSIDAKTQFGVIVLPPRGAQHSDGTIWVQFSEAVYPQASTKCTEIVQGAPIYPGLLACGWVRPQLEYTTEISPVTIPKYLSSGPEQQSSPRIEQLYHLSPVSDNFQNQNPIRNNQDDSNSATCLGTQICLEYCQQPFVVLDSQTGHWLYPDEISNNILRKSISNEDVIIFWTALGTILESKPLMHRTLTLLRKLHGDPQPLYPSTNTLKKYAKFSRQMNLQCGITHKSCGAINSNHLSPTYNADIMHSTYCKELDEIMSILARSEYQVLWRREAISVVPLTCVPTLFAYAVEHRKFDI